MQQDRCEEVHHGPKLEATLELEWDLYSNENERAPQPTTSGQSSPKSHRPKDPGQRRLCAVITFESNSQAAAQEAWLRCWRCVWEGEAAVAARSAGRPWGWTRPGPHTVRTKPQAPRAPDRPGGFGAVPSLDPGLVTPCAKLSEQCLKLCEVFCMSVILQFVVSFFKAHATSVTNSHPQKKSPEGNSLKC